MSVYLRRYYDSYVTILGINEFLYLNMDILFEILDKLLISSAEYIQELEKLDELEISKSNIKIMTEQLANRIGYHVLKGLKKEMIEYQLCKNRLITIFSDFEQYLYSSFKYILLKYPEILNEKKITVNNIIKLRETVNFQVIIEEIVEKELHDLFYEDFQEIFDYAKKKLSFNHNISNELILQLNEAKLVRNLVIHNDGVVNHVFLFKSKKYNHLELGDQIGLSERFVDELSDPIGTCLEEFDKSLIQKFPELELKE